MSTQSKHLPSKAPKFIRANRLSGSHSSRHRSGGDEADDDWEKPVVRPPIRNLQKPTIASTLRAASIRNKVLDHTVARSPRIRTTPAGGSATQRKTAGGATKRDIPVKTQNDEAEVNQVAVKLLDTGVQTNEAEILNHDLLVGDIKLLMPSNEIVKKWEVQKRMERNVTRKFEDYEQNEEQHLDELKEFSERSYVTRRKPKKPPVFPTHAFNPYGNVFKSMDEFFIRDIQKTVSITDIKEGIHRRGVELLTMFDDIAEKSETESES